MSRSDCSELRRALRTTLYQGYDTEYSSIDKAVAAIFGSGQTEKLRVELTDLAEQPEEKIEEVLSDHDVYLWEDISPRELLTTLTTLCKLAD